MPRRAPLPLWALLAAADVLGAGAGSASKDAPAMKMLGCDACQSVMKTLSKDVKYLVEKEMMWETKVLNERLGISCNDPALPTGAMKDACAYLISDYGTAIAKEVAEHWTEDSEKFEEDLVPDEVCKLLGACKEGQQTLGQIMAESQKKEKAQKEAKEDQQKEKAKKDAKEEQEENLRMAKEALKKGGAGDLVNEINKEEKRKKRRQEQLDKNIEDRAAEEGLDVKEHLKKDKEAGFKAAREKMRGGAAAGILNQMEKDIPNVMKKTAEKKKSMEASHSEL